MKAQTISAHKELIAVIQRCQCCHIAMIDPGGKPYVIPMNFGYKDDIIYLHGASTGKKIDILKNNPAVCINFSTDHLLRYQNENVACSWSMKYRSVNAYGNVEFIEDFEQKEKALHVIMSQYVKKDFKFSPPSIREVMVMKLKAERFEGRVYGY